MDPSIQLRVSDAQRGVSPHIRHNEEVDLQASSADISIVNLLWTSPTRSFNRSLHLLLLMMPGSEIIRLLVGNSSLEPKSCLGSLQRRLAIVVEALGTLACNSRGGGEEGITRAGGQMRRQEALVYQTMQPRHVENQMGRMGASVSRIRQSCQDVVYKRRQGASISPTLQPRHEEARRRWEAPINRPVQPPYQEDRKRQEASPTTESCKRDRTLPLRL